MDLVAITILIFLIMDPIGNVSSFLQVLERHSPRQKRRIILREMLFALAMMLLFCYLGERFLGILEMSETTVRLVSGMILFGISLGILFPSPNSLRMRLKPEENPVLVPLAMPLIAGPAILATILLYAHMDPTIYILPLGILIAWVPATIILLFSAQIYRVVGRNGLRGMERLIGMILILLATQRFMEGIQLFVNTYPKHA